MNIFDRIAMLFRANVNAAISAAEQPEKMLNQIILDMRSQLVKAKQQVAAAIADEKRLQDQTSQELKEAEDWERRAMLAVQENRDDLAKQALIRRSEHVSRGQQLQLTWEAHKQETDRLKDSLRTLNDNIEEANRKKNLLLAKARRADAQKRMLKRVSDDRAATVAASLRGRTLEERVEALKNWYLEGDPHMQVQKGEGVYRLVERNCPYINTAMQRPALCSVSVNALSRILGVRVEREKKFQNGDGRCVFLVHVDQPIDSETWEFKLESEMT